jgi:hypothetical protein
MQVVRAEVRPAPGRPGRYGSGVPTDRGELQRGRRALGQGDLRGAASALGAAFATLEPGDRGGDRAAVLALISLVALAGGDGAAGARAASQAVVAGRETTDRDALGLVLAAAARVSVWVGDPGTAARLVRAARVGTGSSPELEAVAEALADVVERDSGLGAGRSGAAPEPVLSLDEALRLAEARCDVVDGQADG